MVERRSTPSSPPATCETCTEIFINIQDAHLAQERGRRYDYICKVFEVRQLLLAIKLRDNDVQALSDLLEHTCNLQKHDG